jgi:hypothetical protein
MDILLTVALVCRAWRQVVASAWFDRIETLTKPLPSDMLRYLSLLPNVRALDACAEALDQRLVTKLTRLTDLSITREQRQLLPHVATTLTHLDAMAETSREIVAHLPPNLSSLSLSLDQCTGDDLQQLCWRVPELWHLRLVATTMQQTRPLRLVDQYHTLEMHASPFAFQWRQLLTLSLDTDVCPDLSCVTQLTELNLTTTRWSEPRHCGVPALTQLQSLSLVGKFNLQKGEGSIAGLTQLTTLSLRMIERPVEWEELPLARLTALSIDLCVLCLPLPVDPPLLTCLRSLDLKNIDTSTEALGFVLQTTPCLHTLSVETTNREPAFLDGGITYDPALLDGVINTYLLRSKEATLRSLRLLSGFAELGQSSVVLDRAACTALVNLCTLELDRVHLLDVDVYHTMTNLTSLSLDRPLVTESKMLVDAFQNGQWSTRCLVNGHKPSCPRLRALMMRQRTPACSSGCPEHHLRRLVSL